MNLSHEKNVIFIFMLIVRRLHHHLEANDQLKRGHESGLQVVGVERSQLALVG